MPATCSLLPVVCAPLPHALPAPVPTTPQVWSQAPVGLGMLVTYWTLLYVLTGIQEGKRGAGRACACSLAFIRCFGSAAAVQLRAADASPQDVLLALHGCAQLCQARHAPRRPVRLPRRAHTPKRAAHVAPASPARRAPSPLPLQIAFTFPRTLQSTSSSRTQRSEPSWARRAPAEARSIAPLPALFVRQELGKPAVHQMAPGGGGLAANVAMVGGGQAAGGWRAMSQRQTGSPCTAVGLSLAFALPLCPVVCLAFLPVDRTLSELPKFQLGSHSRVGVPRGEGVQ